MYDEQQTVFIKKHVKYSHDQFMECIVYSGRPPGPGPRPDYGTNTIQLKYNVKIVSYTEKVEVRMRKKALSDRKRSK